jgi:HprK-related kinase A
MIGASQTLPPDRHDRTLDRSASGSSPPRPASNAASHLVCRLSLGPDAGCATSTSASTARQGPRRWLYPQVNFHHDGQAPFKPLPADQAFALLEWGMNWCIATRAHHYLLLHAAVLERHGKAVILPGEPGAGKSTLTAALMLSGWRLLSDEMTMVDRDDGLIVPLARPVSLKNRSIEIIRAFDREAVFGDVAHDTHKGTVSHLRPSADSVQRMGEKARAAHIVFPRWEAGARPTCAPRQGRRLHARGVARLQLQPAGAPGLRAERRAGRRLRLLGLPLLAAGRALRRFEDLVR